MTIYYLDSTLVDIDLEKGDIEKLLEEFKIKTKIDWLFSSYDFKTFLNFLRSKGYKAEYVFPDHISSKK